MTHRLRSAFCASAIAVAAALAPSFDPVTLHGSLAAAAESAAADSSAPKPKRYSPAAALGDSTRRPVQLTPFRPAAPGGALLPTTPPRSLEGPAIPANVPYLWRTRAERTSWHETADYEETMRYCRQLEAGSPWVRLVTYGTSGQGRALPMLIVSKERLFTPEAARAKGRPVMLVQNGIHAGEIEGKDASLALVRDMAILKTRASLLDSCIVLVLPIYSVDAHERRGSYNRLNQNGPDPTGWRATPVGLNLNRDYMKAEAPETRALLTNVYEKWWPELLVDDHTTDGADYQHDITYAFAHGPAIPAAIDHWYEDAFEGRVVPALTKAGHLPAPYLSFRKGNDPRSGIDYGSSPPRFSTGYAPLQARAAILVETHMLKPYGVRVMATYDLLVALLQEIREHPAALVGAVRFAEREVIARARATDPAARLMPLSAKTTDRAIPFVFLGKQTTWPVSDVTGAPVAHYASAAWDTLIPLYRQMEPQAIVSVPAGYVIPQEWDDAIELLQVQGVQIRRLAKAWSDTVEQARLADWSIDSQPFEGHHPLKIGRVEMVRRWRTFRPGDVWVPADQRSGLMAVHLCEAQAPDGMTVWNFFDTVLQPKEYGEDYVMEPIAKDMLAKDPALAKEFARKLASDSTFAKSPAARVDWFYRRSPWADPDQNLVPVVRALRPVPEANLAPAGTSAPATGR